MFVEIQFRSLYSTKIFQQTGKQEKNIPMNNIINNPISRVLERILVEILKTTFHKKDIRFSVT